MALKGEARSGDINLDVFSIYMVKDHGLKIKKRARTEPWGTQRLRD